MAMKVYISSRTPIQRKSLVKSNQIIYTNNLNDADFVIILKTVNERLSEEQFRDMMLAKEAGKRIHVEKENEKLMKQTRKRLDMEIE